MHMIPAKAVPSIAIASVMAAALALNGGMRSVAQEAARSDRATATEAAAKPTAKIGDRVKITFFESLDIAARGGNGQDVAHSPALQTFYQRMDLSGDFSIDLDGTISLPRLGRFVLDGRSVPDIQADLAIAFSRVMGRPADVNITILERQPVYVVGPVKQPGAYKFVSGMMVIQAIALAGGFENNMNNTSQTIEGIREVERLQKSADQMKRLLARRARLDAERNGQQTLQRPAQLIALAGESGADLYLDAENALLRIELDQRARVKSEAVVGVDLAQAELVALKRKITYLDAQFEVRSERLRDLQKLMNRGMTTRNGVIVVRGELTDIESQRQDALISVVRAEGRLQLAEQTASRVKTEATATLVRAIAAADAEIGELQRSLASSELLMTYLEEASSRLSLTRTTTSTRVAFEIVRQGRDGASVRSANETSVLQPGDVLKIKFLITPSGREIGGTRETRLQRSGFALR
jgi:polysaccharide biosynthesis/export protein ExoF